MVNSTSHLNRADLHAIAVYLHSLAPAPEATHGAAAPQSANGEELYALHCSSCHGVNAEGVPNLFPRLANNSSLQAQDATTITRIVLEGTRAPMTDARPTASAMPAFGWKLDNAEVAAVLSYLRSSHGNNAGPVDASKIAEIRARLDRNP